MEPVTKTEFVLWKNSKVTKMFLGVINERIQQVAQEVVAGGTLGENVGQSTAKAIGYIKGLTDVFNLDFVEVDEDDSTIGT